MSYCLAIVGLDVAKANGYPIVSAEFDLAAGTTTATPSKKTATSAQTTTTPAASSAGAAFPSETAIAVMSAKQAVEFLSNVFPDSKVDAKAPVEAIRDAIRVAANVVDHTEHKVTMNGVKLLATSFGLDIGKKKLEDIYAMIVEHMEGSTADDEEGGDATEEANIVDVSGAEDTDGTVDGDAEDGDAEESADDEGVCVVGDDHLAVAQEAFKAIKANKKKRQELAAARETFAAALDEKRDNFAEEDQAIVQNTIDLCTTGEEISVDEADTYYLALFVDDEGNSVEAGQPYIHNGLAYCDGILMLAAVGVVLKDETGRTVGPISDGENAGEIIPMVSPISGSYAVADLSTDGMLLYSASRHVPAAAGKPGVKKPGVNKPGVNKPGA